MANPTDFTLRNRTSNQIKHLLDVYFCKEWVYIREFSTY